MSETTPEYTADQPTPNLHSISWQTTAEGSLAICRCGWTFECTSPSISLEAASKHLGVPLTDPATANQPAADTVERLSEDGLNAIITNLAVDCVLGEDDARALLTEIGALRADLAQARAEAAALRTKLAEIENPECWALALYKPSSESGRRFVPAWIAGGHPVDIAYEALAAPQSEHARG